VLVARAVACMIACEHAGRRSVDRGVTPEEVHPVVLAAVLGGDRHLPTERLPARCVSTVVDITLACHSSGMQGLGLGIME